MLTLDIELPIESESDIVDLYVEAVEQGCNKQQNSKHLKMGPITSSVSNLGFINLCKLENPFNLCQANNNTVGILHSMPIFVPSSSTTSAARGA